MLHSEGWQYVGLSGRYSGKDSGISATHENQFLIFFRMAEKIKMRQVEEEYWKFTDTSGVGNATNQSPPLLNQTPLVQQGPLKTLPDEQQNSLQQWVGDMNPGMLGLQPRKTNMLNKVDEGSISPGISGSSSETSMPMRIEMSTIPFTKARLVRDPSAKRTKRTSTKGTKGSKSKKTKVPENTFISVVSDESGEWSGTEERP
jgi:hypothetical protein